MRQFPNLEIISSFGVGYDHIDAKAAARLGVIVTNTPGVLDDEVADTALGLMIMTVRQLPQAERYLRAGLWPKGAFPLTPSLRGRTVGIVGLGPIGKAIATRVSGFGLDVVYHGRQAQADVRLSLLSLARRHGQGLRHSHRRRARRPRTRHIINAEVLEALGPDGVLINIARGSLVDEKALIEALRTSKILAAGLDVFENEPNVPQSSSRFTTRCSCPMSARRRSRPVRRWRNAWSGTSSPGPTASHRSPRYPRRLGKADGGRADRGGGRG